MTANTLITTGRFQEPVKTFQQRMFHFDLTAALFTDNMVVVVPCDLVGQVAAGVIGWAHEGNIERNSSVRYTVGSVRPG